jgi:hypothetical protein
VVKFYFVNHREKGEDTEETEFIGDLCGLSAVKTETTEIYR